jgi:hypothetical protein
MDTTSNLVGKFVVCYLIRTCYTNYEFRFGLSNFEKSNPPTVPGFNNVLQNVIVISFLKVILVGNNDVPTVYCNQGFANGFNVNRNFFQNDFR